MSRNPGTYRLLPSKNTGITVDDEKISNLKNFICYDFLCSSAFPHFIVNSYALLFFIFSFLFCLFVVFVFFDFVFWLYCCHFLLLYWCFLFFSLLFSFVLLLLLIMIFSSVSLLFSFILLLLSFILLLLFSWFFYIFLEFLPCSEKNTLILFSYWWSKILSSVSRIPQIHA